MANMKLYRVVCPIAERVNEVVCTSPTVIVTPRIAETVRLSPVFEKIVDFWEKTGCQLTTAVQALTEIPKYLISLNSARVNHYMLFPARFINEKDETIFKTEELTNYIESYMNQNIVLPCESVGTIWEFLWERIRRKSYPQCISRYTCLFTFETKANAERYLKECKDEDAEYNKNTHILDKVCEVEVLESQRMEQYDMHWLNDISIFSTYDLYEQMVTDYWSGKLTKDPLMECLFHGVYRIILA